MKKRKMREEIENLIRKTVRSSFNIELEKIDIEKPTQESFGDYSTNVALVLAKKLGKNPREIAKAIISDIGCPKVFAQPFFERIEVAGPGFINFFLAKEYLQNQIAEILKQKEKYGNLKIGKGKKVQVEFISANPTGPLTVGNARGGPLGDVLANVLKKAGYKAEKAYYINNYGAQILSLGHSVLKDGQPGYRGGYIDYLRKKIKEKNPCRAGQRAAAIIIKEMIKKTIGKMGIKFDEWISENDFYKKGEVGKVLDFLRKKNLLYEKEGAVWFKSSQFGDERDRVVVKSDHENTYLAGDIALHKYKFAKKKFDKVINVWGADHYGDAPGLQAGVEAIGHKGKLDIIFCQFITLLEKGVKQKMSKRQGTYVAMDELLDKAGKDATRFFFLQKSASSHLIFDMDLAKEQSAKNPVFYVEYAHARICSILKKINKASPNKFQRSLKFVRGLVHPSELDLIKQLIRLPEIIEDIAKDYQVQRLPEYALELARAFHQFYAECRVIDENNKNLTQTRLALVRAAKIVLKNMLDLMGISAPEKM